MEDVHDEKKQRIRDRTRQLILMRETGPKSRAWHAARVRLIWRLHEELRQAERAADGQAAERERIDSGLGADKRRAD
ncbi:MAG TPA: hypothetical protein VNL77_19675 [Roseiflexaceae bacterium]|nr:hypothetical protein [Roseiflexaceae bacterium]